MRFRNVFRLYTRTLQKHTLATQIITGGTLWFAGDLLCQKVVSKDPLDDKIDWKRVARMTIYGLCISAPIYTFWYSFLEKISQKLFTSHHIPNLSSQLLHTRRAWRIIGFKLAMDTLVFDPAYLTLFFTASSIMESSSSHEIWKKIESDLFKTWIIDVTVWSPIQTLNFRFIPVSYQALVVQTCNIGWNAYLSFIQHKH